MPKNIITEDKVKKGKQVKNIINILFADKAASADQLDAIREWLVNEKHQDFKEEALRNRFKDIYKYEKDYSKAPELWNAFVRNIEMKDEDITKVKKLIKLPSRKPLYKLTLFRVAAVLIPLLIMGTVLTFLFNKAIEATDQDINNMITVSTIDDSEREIILPDSSRVVMKSGSVIEYPENFKKKRYLKLYGEAFFSVTKDEKNPFTVESYDLKITVLGTEFVVRSYEDQNEQEVILVSGVVSVATQQRTVILEPLQCIKVDKEKQTIELDQIEVEELMRIKGVKLHFEKVSLDDILKTIGIYFNVEIIVTKDMDLSEELFILFDEDTKLEEVFTILKIAYPIFDFNIKGDTVIIEPKYDRTDD